VLAAIYMLWAYQQAFHHEPDAANANTPDISWREGAVVAPLVVLIIFLGVYPKPVLDRISPSVNRLVHHVDQATDTHQPAVETTHRSGPAGRAGTSATGRVGHRAPAPSTAAIGTVRRSP
jgi:NADH-quinone oxidoreductase subunit M